MKIAVSAAGVDLDSEVDPQFARARYFILVDSESLDFETIENPNRMLRGGAAVGSARLLVDKGADVVLSGSCGPNAFRTLSLAGIRVVPGARGKVRSAVTAFLHGRLHATPGPPPAAGPGMRRMGMWWAGPRGRGPRRGLGGPASFPGVGSVYRERWKDSGTREELQMLRMQAESLKVHLEQIMDRIEELEGEEE